MMSKETNLQVGAGSPAANLEDKQRRRMLIALALLLVALIVVLVKDRQFWFSSAGPSEPVTEEPATSVAPTTSSQSTTSSIPRQPAQSTVAPKPKKLNGKNAAARVVSQGETQAASGPAIIATNRAVLPPLEVEVVAGNKRRALSPNNNSVKVDMDSSASSGLTAPSGSAPEQASVSAVPDASARVTLPPATAERVSRSVKPDYPMLAKQMKVQGAVVLQALIDKAGNIQELHVVTGPAILASAAQEAVKQWRFKPYYQQGQAVETEARITVNFTISTY
jgi:TonB family protein